MQATIKEVQMNLRQKLISLTISLFIILFTSPAIACMSDIDCGVGNQCVKPADSISLNGTCITPTDENGIPTNNFDPPSVEPHEIQGCQFNTDCNIGFSCMKKSGELSGICVK